MQAFYEAAGTTRQAHHQWRQPSELAQKRTPEELVVLMAKEVRREHLPGSGARELYAFIRKKLPEHSELLTGWGKHRFEKCCLGNGLRVVSRRFVPKTTTRGQFVFPNLIEGATINASDRVWVSDITYIFDADGKLIGYATSLIDLYDKWLLGLAFSTTMHAAVTSRAVLEQALRQKKAARFDGLSFHSDMGKQYIESGFLATLRSHGIASSMARNCFENPVAEAFNDVLKNHLLHDTTINSIPQLKKIAPFLIDCYNHNKPHSALAGMTPLEFRNWILDLPISQRPLLEIKVVA